MKKFANWLTEILNYLKSYSRTTDEHNVVDIEPAPNANIWKYDKCLQCWQGMELPNAYIYARID